MLRFLQSGAHAVVYTPSSKLIVVGTPERSLSACAARLILGDTLQWLVYVCKIGPEQQRIVNNISSLWW
jgi:hypothetical protein